MEAKQDEDREDSRWEEREKMVGGKKRERERKKEREEGSEWAAEKEMREM